MPEGRLAVSALVTELVAFYLAVGPYDTSITEKNASRACFRFAPSLAMLAQALGDAIAQPGLKAYYLGADYAFGHDSVARIRAILESKGGSTAGVDFHPTGTTDFSSYMTKIRSWPSARTPKAISSSSTSASLPNADGNPRERRTPALPQQEAKLVGQERDRLGTRCREESVSRVVVDPHQHRTSTR